MAMSGPPPARPSSIEGFTPARRRVGGFLEQPGTDLRGQRKSPVTTVGRRFSLVFSRALGKVIAHVHGALDAESAQELQDRLIDVIDGQGNRSVIIDLASTTFIDSLGLSVLFDAWRRMHDRGGEFMLSGPKNDVARVILASDLENVFVITPAWTHPVHGDSRIR